MFPSQRKTDTQVSNLEIIFLSFLSPLSTSPFILCLPYLLHSHPSPAHYMSCMFLSILARANLVHHLSPEFLQHPPNWLSWFQSYHPPMWFPPSILSNLSTNVNLIMSFFLRLFRYCLLPSEWRSKWLMWNIKLLYSGLRLICNLSKHPLLCPHPFTFKKPS